MEMTPRTSTQVSAAHAWPATAHAVAVRLFALVEEGQGSRSAAAKQPGATRMLAYDDLRQGSYRSNQFARRVEELAMRWTLVV